AGHDHLVGSLTVDLKPDSELLNSTGTTEGLLFLQNKPSLSEKSFKAKLSNGIYVKNSLFSYFGSLPSAGYSIEWLRNLLGMQ
ncbi:hypothetical protein, partial [Alkalibacillus haloalkaliphilus]|uniref:hypothetical protein n=1 Tax=Alkalibacillus haloalkaliphilus TaxID=94136 RepID=UPI00293539E9